MEGRQKRSYLNTMIRGIDRISLGLGRHRIRVYAAQAAFFMTVSILPMLLVLLSALGFLLPDGGEALTERLGQVIPGEFSPLAETVLAEAGSKADPKRIPISVLMLLWSASRGIRGIGAGIRNVCGTKERQGFLSYALGAILDTLLFLGTVLLALGLLLSGDRFLPEAVRRISPLLASLFRSGAAAVLLVFVFLLTFRNAGGQRGRLSDQLPGALFASLGWLLYSRVFALYIRYAAGSSLLYGTISAMVAVMLWLYACIEILLIGAGLNRVWAERIRAV